MAGGGGYEFPILLVVDRLSLPFMVLTTVLTGLVGLFSTNYLHRDDGYRRFFILLHLFAFGVLLLTMGGTLDMLLAGWELVGLTSALLIAFFQNRRTPAANAMRAYITYRACDVGLLVAAVLMHHYAHTAVFERAFGGPWPTGSAGAFAGDPTLMAALLLWAAMGKSAQVPLSGWLPRAMEGPTPSSAVFYGALSIHAGAYLLLRTEPLLDRAPIVAGVMVTVGLASAVHATLVGRVQSDAKSALAYASMAQVGIIFMEIGLGFRLLAVLHICGNAVVRTLQFLRAPSMLQDYHRIEAGVGGSPRRTGLHYEMVLPEGLRRWLYRLAIDRGHHDTILERFIVRPFLALARLLDDLERSWVGWLTGEREEISHQGSAAQRRGPSPRIGPHRGGPLMNAPVPATSCPLECADHHLGLP
ncbi:MAG: proton-conducting transporter membrane subunit [Polyangiaceae bacterium]